MVVSVYLHKFSANICFRYLQESVLVTYHSKFTESGDLACGFPLIPYTAKAAYNSDAKTHDIVDEAIC